MMSAALAISSFATSVTHLIVTQGILYGIGGSFSYSTCLLLQDQWFDKRKGLAFGIMLVSSWDSCVVEDHTDGPGRQVQVWAAQFSLSLQNSSSLVMASAPLFVPCPLL